MSFNRKALGVAVAGFGLVLTGGLGVGSVIAAEADPTATTDASTSGSAVTKEKCTWFLEGVPTSVAMATDGSDYEGAALPMTASAGTLQAYVSGNLGTGEIDTHSACTWYGSTNVRGITVSMATSATGFTSSEPADATDTSLSFDPTAGLPFLIDFAGEAACRTPGNDGNGTEQWTVTDLSIENATGTTATSVMAQPFANSTGIPLDTAEKNDACSSAMTWSVSIPGDLEPDAPGATYSFTGPTVTTSVALPSE